MNLITLKAETFQVVEANSFDEARREVEKAVHDQELLEERYFSEREAKDVANTRPTGNVQITGANNLVEGAGLGTHDGSRRFWPGSGAGK